MSDPILSPRAPAPVGPYPHARRVGNFIFVSGTGPRQPGTGDIPGVSRAADGSITAHDIEVQTRSCIENIRTILEDAGASLANVVDVLAFLTDLEHDFEGFNRAYREYFGEILPTRTTVGVTSLPTAIAVELKVVAVV